MEKVWVNIIDILWPVGSLYWCVNGNESDPTRILGGFWIQCQDKTITVGNQTFICYRRYA